MRAWSGPYPSPWRKTAAVLLDTIHLERRRLLADAATGSAQHAARPRPLCPRLSIDRPAAACSSEPVHARLHDRPSWPRRTSTDPPSQGLGERARMVLGISGNVEDAPVIGVVRGPCYVAWVTLCEGSSHCDESDRRARGGWDRAKLDRSAPGSAGHASRPARSWLWSRPLFAIALPAKARYATGGTGRYLSGIDWVEWGTARPERHHEHHEDQHANDRYAHGRHHLHADRPEREPPRLPDRQLHRRRAGRSLQHRRDGHLEPARLRPGEHGRRPPR